jgi:hypothetical protein
VTPTRRESIRKNCCRLSRVNVLVFFVFAFILLFSGQSFAATVHVSSDPIARGSVTPGYDDLVLQAITMRTDSDTAQLQGITINEFGTASATSTVSQLRLFSETNGIGGLQIGSDTSMTVAPTVFVGESTNFTLSTPLTIADTDTTLYVVYSIRGTAQTDYTVGSSLTNETAITLSVGNTVAPFTSLNSREISVVQTPHATDIEPTPFSDQTNLCQLCHAVHIAPDFRDSYGFSTETVNKFSLTQPYFEAPSAINTTGSDAYNALCFSCHDGTGSATDIKGMYNSATVDFAGHETSETGSSTTGFKAPPAGQSYSANKKMPCLVCHDLHGSERGNYKIMSDSLYTYSTTNGWSDPNANGRIDFGNEACQVCHALTSETTRTVEVMGLNLKDIPATHESTDTYSGDCISAGCHNNPHALD